MKLFIVYAFCLAFAMGYYHEGIGGHSGDSHGPGTVSKRGHFSIEGGLSHSGGNTHANVGLSYHFKKRLAELEEAVEQLKLRKGLFSIEGGVSHSGGNTQANVGLSYHFKKRLAELEEAVEQLKRENSAKAEVSHDKSGSKVSGSVTHSSHHSDGSRTDFSGSVSHSSHGGTSFGVSVSHHFRRRLAELEEAVEQLKLRKGHFSIDGGVSHSGGDTRVNVGLSYNWKRLAELEKEVADLEKRYSEHSVSGDGPNYSHHGGSSHHVNGGIHF